MVSLIEMGLMADKEVAARLLLQAINYVLEHDQYNCTCRTECSYLPLMEISRETFSGSAARPFENLTLTLRRYRCDDEYATLLCCVSCCCCLRLLERNKHVYSTYYAQELALK